MNQAQWEEYSNFSEREFNCKHTGKNEMKHEFMVKLQALRTELGFPFIINSGYRDRTHPVEARKSSPGQHSLGIAVDIQAQDGATAYRIAQAAFKHGFTGIGIAQDNRRSRPGRFVHLDIRTTTPVMWSY